MKLIQSNTLTVQKNRNKTRLRTLSKLFNISLLLLLSYIFYIHTHICLFPQLFTVDGSLWKRHRIVIVFTFFLNIFLAWVFEQYISIYSVIYCVPYLHFKTNKAFCLQRVVTSLEYTYLSYCKSTPWAVLYKICLTISLTFWFFVYIFLFDFSGNWSCKCVCTILSYTSVYK